ncbi:two-component system sensor histidine kinase ComP [Paenibacillus amylolyticus]|uniref:histidine kinase n=1 Tax=Paenibacillus amylolyticus TaxID=1451 RepID=A0AAP5H2Z3_PAEAM|nr:two-component system sensor histidine kinase ComP [Paenibacillus amylolyticus]
MSVLWFATILCFVLTATYLHTSSYLHPYIGLSLKLSHTNQWVVHEVDPEGVASSSGIRSGEIVVSIEPQGITKLLNQDDIYTVSDASAIHVENPLGQTVQYSMKPGFRELFNILFSSTMELLLLFTGSYALFSQPGSRVMRLFYLLNLSMAICILTIYTSQLSLSNYILAFCAAWLPYWLIAFYLSFAFRTQQHRFRLLLFISKCVAIAYSAGLFFLYIKRWLLSEIQLNHGMTIVKTSIAQSGPTNLLNFIFCMTLLFVIGITWFNRKNYSRKEQNQLLLMSTGIIVSLIPFIFGFAVPTLLQVDPLLPVEYTLIGFIPLSWMFTYVLVQRSMLDFKLVMPRLIIHVMYALSVFALLVIASKLDKLIQIGMLFVLFLLITWVYQYSQTYSRRKNKLNKEWLERQQLRLTVRMAEQQSMRDMFRLFAEMFHKMLDIEGVAIIWADDHNRFSQEGTGTYATIADINNDTLNVESLLQQYGFAQVWELSGEPGAEVAGYLGIGHKRNHTLFSAEEQDIIDQGRLEAIRMLVNSKLLSDLQKRYEHRVSQTALHEHQIRRHREFNDILMEAQQAERIKTSYFLHDQLLQNLIFLSRDLEEFHDTGETNTEQTAVWLDCLYTSQQDIRQLCDDLYPHIIDRSELQESLQWLVRTLQVKSDIILELSCGTLSAEVEQEPLKSTVFRTIRELIINVMKHSQASRCSIQVYIRDNDLICQVKDDGLGFDVHSTFDFSKATSGHFGLISIHSNIQHLSGEITINSSPGKGTSINIGLPLRAKELYNNE